MTIQLRIKHTTGYTYENGAAASYNEARVTPLTTSDQYVLRSRFEVTPTAWSMEYRDYWGTAVTAFEVHDPHDELTVVATTTVETSEHEQHPGDVAWEALEAVRDEYCEFLVPGSWVAPPPSLVPELERLRATSPTPGDFARSVGALVHERIRYLPGATSVTSTAAEAWDAGAGVCQDLAHVMIGALRWARIPARYVSGYLHPSPDPQIGDTVEGESHAWVEWWDGEWIGHDPTNDIAPSERHVVVARGRDYSDSPPLRGIYSTEGVSSLFVNVEITRLR